MRKIVKRILESNGYVLFVVIACIYIDISLFTNSRVLTDGVLYNSFAGQMPEHYIQRAIDFQHKWEWVGYALTPIIMAVRQLFVCGFVAASTMLTEKLMLGEEGITFGQIYKSVLVSEIVLLVVAIANLGIVLLHGVNDLQQLQQLSIDHHLSLGALIDGIDGLEWLVEPLRMFNLSQVLYMTAMAYCLSNYNHQNFVESLSTVFKGYGFLLLIVAMITTYLSLTYG